MGESDLLNISGLFHKYGDRFLADDSLTNVDVLLLSLYLIEQRTKTVGAPYSDVKELFVSLGRKEDGFKVSVFRAKKESLIEDRENTLSFLVKGLKKVWAFIGQIAKSRVYILKSGEHFTAIKLFEEFLQNEMKDGEILLSDTWISPSTLFPFSTLKGKLKYFRILTSNITEIEKFREYKKKFEKEMELKLEIRKNTKVHDRWLICGEKCWSLGGSIKDLGNKDTIISELNDVKDSLKELFEVRWEESEKFE